MKPLTYFGKKTNDNSQLLTKAANSRLRFFVPPSEWANPWVIDQPVVFDDCLLMCGGFGMSHGTIPHSKIRGTANLGVEPMFHRNGAYNYYDIATSKDVWKETTLGIRDTLGAGLSIQIDHMAFESFNPFNSIIQMYNSGFSYIRNCSFGPYYRGVEAYGFDTTIDQCLFSSNFLVDWLSDTERVTESYGLYAGSHTSVTRCNFQGGITGASVVASGNYFLGNRVEVNIHGLILGGSNNTQADMLWATQATVIQGNTFESNLRAIDARMFGSTVLTGNVIIGTNAPQLDGISRGPCEYGLNATYADKDMVIAANTISGAFSKGCMNGNNVRGVNYWNSLNPTDTSNQAS